MSGSLRLGDRSQGRDNNFDFLRFALATLVILSHSYPLLRGDNRTEPLMRLTGGQHTFGECAVEGFFVLSGFLIAQSWQRSRGLWDYLRRRVFRIYPGFAAAVVITVLVAGPLGASDMGSFWGWFRPQQLAWGIANLSGYEPRASWMFPGNAFHALNGSLWSIRYEVFCYLGVAALGFSGLLGRRQLVLGLLAASLVFYWKVLHGGLETRYWRGQGYVGDYSTWARMAPSFLAGTVFYLYREWVPCSGALWAASMAGLVVSGLTGGFALLFPIFGAYWLLYLAFTPRVRLHGFGHRGDLSYGLYLYAFPLQQLLVQGLGQGLAPVVLFGLAFVGTAACALLSWRLVERPFMKMKGQARVARVDVETVARSAVAMGAEAIAGPEVHAEAGVVGYLTGRGGHSYSAIDS